MMRTNSIFSAIANSILIVVLTFTLFVLFPVDASAETVTSGDYEYTDNDDGTVVINKYIGTLASNGKLVIPGAIDGKTVVALESLDNESVVPVTIVNCTLPSSLTKIGKYSFYNCDLLKSVNIPDNVECLDDYSFYCCKSLENVSIPDKVTYLGNYTFGTCKSIKSISFPEGLKTIGANSFHNCINLESVNFPSDFFDYGNSAFTKTKWLDSMKNKSEFIIINNHLCEAYPKSSTVKVPDEITHIGQFAFASPETRSIVEKVTLPSGIVSIGKYAFYYCQNLTQINLPKTVQSIGDFALQETSISKLELPDDLQSIGRNAFAYNKNIKQVILPKNITSINFQLFDSCSSLESVVFLGNIEG